MERLKWRWTHGPQTRLLILFAACLPLLVLACGTATSIGVIVYITTFR